MAHIADLMVDVPGSAGLNNYIARELSPSPVQLGLGETPSMDDKKEHIWRMHQPTEVTTARKYQLFPAKEKLLITAIHKSSDVELSQSTMAGQVGTIEKDRSILGGALRLKPKEQNLIRRRKVSVPELGPMTTVQEVAMDSPTIPGRPPLHERSISAPGNSWRQHIFADSILSCIPGPALDEAAEMAVSTAGTSNAQAVANIGPFHHPSTLSIEQPLLQTASSKLPPLSPKVLAPLVIPSQSQPPPRLNRSTSRTRLRAGSEGAPEVPPKSARMMEASPLSKISPFTPSSATSNILSASTAPTSVASTPAGEGRSSPKPWNTAPNGRCSPKQWMMTGRSSPKPLISSSAPNTTSLGGHSRNQSEVNLSSTSHTLTHQTSFPTIPYGHRRHESEGGASTATSIMDRGRPKKRSDGSPIKPTIKRSPSNPNRPPALTFASSISTSPARSIIPTSTTSKSEEQKAFEHLPTGCPSTSAHNLLPASELSTLRKQALGQASRFQVLAAKDVEALSRELRALDERCEYLRKTHRSLRSGRRNLHERICSYLRSPRVARFSGEAMLKQEESLSELDRSIDDWVSKLEQAENRRTRVRQKLLEHVAAALIMEAPTSPSSSPTNQHHQQHHQQQQHIISQSLGENTPPRSPIKASSPDRLERVVEEVRSSTPPSTSSPSSSLPSSTLPASTYSSFTSLPSTLEEETTPTTTTSPERERISSMLSAHSIRIYADSDVYALMDCVEEEINRLGEQEEKDASDQRAKQAQLEQEQEQREREQKQLQREREWEKEQQREQEEEMRRRRKRREEKEQDTIAAGITLNAVTFDPRSLAH